MKEQLENQEKYRTINVGTFFELTPDQVKQTVFMANSNVGEGKNLALKYVGNGLYGNRLANVMFQLSGIITLALLGEVDITIPEKFIT